MWAWVPLKGLFMPELFWTLSDFLWPRPILGLSKSYYFNNNSCEKHKLTTYRRSMITFWVTFQLSKNRHCSAVVISDLRQVCSLYIFRLIHIFSLYYQMLNFQWWNFCLLCSLGYFSKISQNMRKCFCHLLSCFYVWFQNPQL